VRTCPLGLQRRIFQFVKKKLLDSKYFETNGHKIDTSYNINTNTKLTRIDDQSIVIKRIGDKKKLITHLYRQRSFSIVHEGNEGSAIQVYQLPAKITFT